MNKLFQGDNLNIMRDMPDASVDLICTDPPFNTGKDWGAFDDRWEGGLKGYLKFMEARVVEMRRVLKDTGSLYLHCDPTASHYLKVMLDGVFGIKQFRAEIIWKRHAHKSNMARKKFYTAHDSILFYACSENNLFNMIYSPTSETSKKRYNLIDENGDKYGIFRDKSRRKEPTRVYLKNSKGVALDTLWTEKLQLASSSKERLGYPTQKPLALYERMIKASSNQHDTVLDPFAGSGTTLDAAQSLGRQWIGIDIGDEAIQTIQKRLEARHGLLLQYEVC